MRFKFSVNTLGNIVGLLRKISRRDIQNSDQEIVPMKQHFTARENVRDLYPVFFCILVAIVVCIFSDLIIYLGSKLSIFGEYGGFKFRPLSIKISCMICLNLHRK